MCENNIEESGVGRDSGGKVEKVCQKLEAFMFPIVRCFVMTRHREEDFGRANNLRPCKKRFHYEVAQKHEQTYKPAKSD